MARHGDSPRQIQPRNGKITEPLGYKIFHFLLPAGRSDETRLANQGFDLSLVAREPKEQIAFIAPLQRLLVGGAVGSRGRCRIVLEFLAGHAVPALLPPLHHITAGDHPLKKLLHDLAVAPIGGSHKAIVADLPAVPELAVTLAHCITVGLGSEALGLSRALNLQAMLIAACDEHHRLTLQPLVAGNGIAGQGRVGTAEMGPIVDVIKRSGEGKNHAAGVRLGVDGGLAAPSKRPCAGAGSYRASPCQSWGDR